MYTVPAVAFLKWWILHNRMPWEWHVSHSADKPCVCHHLCLRKMAPHHLGAYAAIASPCPNTVIAVLFSMLLLVPFLTLTAPMPQIASWSLVGTVLFVWLVWRDIPPMLAYSQHCYSSIYVFSWTLICYSVPLGLSPVRNLLRKILCNAVCPWSDVVWYLLWERGYK